MSKFSKKDEHYCIRKDYSPNKGNITFDIPGSIFWTDRRVEDSYRYQWHVYKYAQFLVKQNGVSAVLDIGCGPATKLARLIAPVAKTYGIDQPSAIEYCKLKYPDGKFYSDNFEKPTVNLDVSFDMIICSDVIEHMDDPDVLLKYIKRFCGADTLICISTPDRVKLRGKTCITSPKEEHVREWSASEFRCYLEDSGLEVIEQRHFPPVKSEFGKLFFIHLIYQLIRGHSYSYNQFLLCQLKK